MRKVKVAAGHSIRYTDENGFDTPASAGAVITISDEKQYETLLAMKAIVDVEEKKAAPAADEKKVR